MACAAPKTPDAGASVHSEHRAGVNRPCGHDSGRRSDGVPGDGRPCAAPKTWDPPADPAAPEDAADAEASAPWAVELETRSVRLLPLGLLAEAAAGAETEAGSIVPAPRPARRGRGTRGNVELGGAWPPSSGAHSADSSPSRNPETGSSAAGSSFGPPATTTPLSPIAVGSAARGTMCSSSPPPEPILDCGGLKSKEPEELLESLGVPAALPSRSSQKAGGWNRLSPVLELYQ